MDLTESRCRNCNRRLPVRGAVDSARVVIEVQCPRCKGWTRVEAREAQPAVR